MIGLGLAAAFAAGSDLNGHRGGPYTSFNYMVFIDGIPAGGFSEVTGLQMEVEVEDYREGGNNNFIHKLPGPARFPSTLTLKRGLTSLSILWVWAEAVRRGNIDRKTGSVMLLNRMGLPVMLWEFEEAYPSKWIGPDLRANANEIAVETVELMHHGITRVF